MYHINKASVCIVHTLMHIFMLWKLSCGADQGVRRPSWWEVLKVYLFWGLGIWLSPREILESDKICGFMQDCSVRVNDYCIRVSQ